MAKVADAQLAWTAQAQEIRAGKKRSMFKMLEERGYIHQTAGSVHTFCVPLTLTCTLIEVTEPEKRLRN